MGFSRGRSGSSVRIVLTISVVAGVAGQASRTWAFPSQFDAPTPVVFEGGPYDMRAFSITPDGQIMLLTIWDGAARLYKSTWDAGAGVWSSPVDLGFSGWRNSASFGPDGQSMYYSSHGTVYYSSTGAPANEEVTNLTGFVNGPVRIAHGQAYYGHASDVNHAHEDIWSATYDPNNPAGGFADFGPLAGISPGTAREGNPYVTPDGSILLFDSDMPGGYGGYDIYRATWDAGSQSWVNITNLGPKVNSAAEESIPFYAPQTGLLYFTRTPNPAVPETGVLMQAGPESVIPEPASVVTGLIGLAVIGGYIRKRLSG